MGSLRAAEQMALVAFLSLVCLVATSPAQGPQPNGLRIQTRDAGGEGVWVTVPNHHYLGSPCFSPDGEWVAFDAYRSGGAKVVCEVWIVRRDGKDLKMLTTGATPRWSPDNKQLIFMREQRNEEPDKQPNGIFIISSDGQGERFLMPGRWPDWSPDGRHIAFSLGDPNTLRGGSLPLSRVYVCNPNGENPQAVCNGDCPAWSPDGKQIAACYQDPALPAPMIRIVNFDSGEQHFAGYGWFRANWDSKGESLGCNGYTQEQGEGMVILSAARRREPSSAKALLTEFSEAQSPAFSRDGKFVTFTAPRAE